jgi:hypothetical protein
MSPERQSSSVWCLTAIAGLAQHWHVQRVWTRHNLCDAGATWRIRNFPDCIRNCFRSCFRGCLHANCACHRRNRAAHSQSPPPSGQPRVSARSLTSLDQRITDKRGEPPVHGGGHRWCDVLISKGYSSQCPIGKHPKTWCHINPTYPHVI